MRLPCSDDRLQLTAQNVTRQIGQQTTTLMGLTYGYTSIAGASGVGTNSGNSGQLMSITGTINSQTRDQAFTYDDMGRLATATGWGRWGRRFTYDRWGNRTKTEELLPPSVWCTKQVMDFKPGTSGPPLTNQATSVEEYANCSRTSVSPNYYDAAGNTTSYGNNGWISYVYDGESRLVRFQGSLGQSLGEYSYDAGNRRVKRIAGGVTTHYVWEGGQVIAEYNGVTGVLICEYIYAGSRMLAREQSGVLRYYHQDRLSTRMITDSSGQVVGTQDHMPFGEDATGEESKEQEKHRFTSYERDSESKTDYAVNRQYGTAIGRFMRPDPVAGFASNPQSLNRYAYVSGDPVNLSDPAGLCTISIGLTTNRLLSVDQERAMQGEIRRIYGNAGFQIDFVSNNADYRLNVNARGDAYKSFYKNLPDDAVGVTGKSGLRVDNSGRVFVDRLSASAGSGPTFEQDSNNLGIALGRAGSHEIGHYLLQQAYDSAAIQGVMHRGYHGEQWYSRTTQGLWTFDSAQIARIGSKVCITPQNAPLNYAPIGPRYLGSLGGYPGWFSSLLGFLDWMDSIGEGTVTSTYKLEYPNRMTI